MKCLPFEPAAIERYGSIADWQAEAPSLVASALARWRLTAGEAYVGGIAGSVLAVTRESGDHAVLKIGYPHPEAVWEGVGLQAFPPGTAAEVVDQDVWTWALLLVPVAPGLPLSRSGLTALDALRIGGRLHARLIEGRTPEGLPTLGEAMAAYALTARATARSEAASLATMGVADLVRRAIDDLERLAGDHTEQVLLHGDYNPGNILSAGEDGWVVIDPKPLVGDPAYDLWPLITQVGEPYRAVDPARVLREHVNSAAAAAGVDASRVAAWSLARTGLNVAWHLADGNRELALSEAVGLRAWAALVAS